MTTVEIELETRLVAYLQENFQEEGDPLNGIEILGGHTAHPTAERPPSYLCITCTAAGGELAYAGIHEVVARALMFSQADDVPIADHSAAVQAVRAIFSDSELTAALAAISDEVMALTAWSYEGSQEGRDEAANKHGTEETWRGWCAFL